MGLYAVGISTAATLVSILVSSLVLYLGIKVGAHVNSKWVGFALIGMYVLGIGFGIVLGAITGFFLTRRLANRLSW
jgi:uncharacterized protein YneF (UPF0154 family)